MEKMNKNNNCPRPKRMFIQLGNFRITPDAISAYAPLSEPNYPSGIILYYPNGKYIKLKLSEIDQANGLKLLDQVLQPKF